MTTLPILLLGAGGHARSCIDVIEHDERYVIAGLIGLAHEVGTRVLGYPVLGTDADLPALRDEFAHAMVAAGQIKTPQPRQRLHALLDQAGYVLPVVISPRAHVSRHAVLGAGTMVMHGAVVNAGAVVGCNCIINSMALVEHDVTIGDHCHIATAAVVNGGASIGAGTFVGSNSCVRESIRIGERCLIGMGQRVVADCAAATRIPAARREP